jgi:hypothetical protein
MRLWEVTFLVTGFQVRGHHRIGKVRFSEPAVSGTPEARLLQNSADESRCIFDPIYFARASSTQSGEQPYEAARNALFELDRTLDTLVFTDFGCSKYLPVGYAVPVDAAGAGCSLAFTETFPPSPILHFFAESRYGRSRATSSQSILPASAASFAKSAGYPLRGGMCPRDCLAMVPARKPRAWF